MSMGQKFVILQSYQEILIFKIKIEINFIKVE